MQLLQTVQSYYYVEMGKLGIPLNDIAKLARMCLVIITSLFQTVAPLHISVYFDPLRTVNYLAFPAKHDKLFLVPGFHLNVP